MFNNQERTIMIKKLFEQNERIIIKQYSELTVQFCLKNNATNIIRGIRNSSDFEYEQNIAFTNYELENRIESVFLPSCKNTTFISSSIVREIILNHGPLEGFVPKEIINYIQKQKRPT